MKVRDVRPGHRIGGERVELTINRAEGTTEIHYATHWTVHDPGTRLCDECGTPGFFNLCPTHRRLEDAAHGYPDDAA